MISPPTYKLVALAAMAWTTPFTPELNADQLLPSHFATLATVTPPAVSKLPPTYTLVPLTATALINPLAIPDPRGDQFLPSHLAILLTMYPPAVRKSPPA